MKTRTWFWSKVKIKRSVLKILENPVITVVTEEDVVYQNDIPLGGVREVVDFGPKVRVRFNRGTNRLCDKESVRVETGGQTTVAAKRVLEYWTDIARHTSVKDEQQDRDSFLKQQFDKLKFVSPRSVLSCYLHGNAISVDPQTESDTIFPFKFNLSQKEALDNALRSQISIIEGPPGTGKTQTILNILANLAVMHHKRVAVVSGNNAAVQNVHDKLAAAGYGFLVASLGNNENKKRFFDNPPGQDVSDWESDVEEGELSAQIQGLNGRIHHLMQVEREIALLQQQLSAYRLEQEHSEAGGEGGRPTGGRHRDRHDSQVSGPREADDDPVDRIGQFAFRKGGAAVRK